MTQDDKQEIIRKCGKQDWTCLYIMVFFVLMQCCGTASKDDVEQLAKQIQVIQSQR